MCLWRNCFSADALQQKAQALSLDAQAKLDKKAAALEAKADVKAEADSKKKKVCTLISCTCSPNLISNLLSLVRPPRYVPDPFRRSSARRGINQLWDVVFIYFLSHR